VPVYSIPGNHDLAHDNEDSIKDQPYGVLVESGAIVDVRHDFLEVDGVKLEIFGFPFKRKVHPEDFKITKDPSADYAMVIAHIFSDIKGGEFFGERIIPYAAFFEHEADLYHFGHPHWDKGAAKYSGKWFVNIGSLSRGAAFKDNKDRIPRVAVADFGKEKISMKLIALSVTPGVEVFDFDKKELVEREQKDIDEFLAALYAERTTEKTIEQRLDEMPDMELEVKRRVLSYLGEAAQEAV
jgi:DNA repair exonuclease SbcCD nuclease subunit